MERIFIQTRDDARRLIRGLLWFETVLVLLYLGERVFGSPFWFIRRLTDLDGERSLAMWFSAIQLFAVGAVLLLKARRPGALAPIGAMFLYVVGAGFVFLSADEALSFHESLTDGLKRFDYLPRFNGGHGMWIPIYLAAVTAFGAISARRVLFLWRGFRGPTVVVLAGFSLFVIGAVGVELIGYRLIGSATPLAQALEIACEEWLEMAGITLVLSGALGLAREEATPVPASVAEARLPARTP